MWNHLVAIYSGLRCPVIFNQKAAVDKSIDYGYACHYKKRMEKWALDKFQKRYTKEKVKFSLKDYHKHFPPSFKYLMKSLHCDQRTRKSTKQNIHFLNQINQPLLHYQYKYFFPKIWIFGSSGEFLVIANMRAPKFHAEPTDQCPEISHMRPVQA